MPAMHLQQGLGIESGSPNATITLITGLLLAVRWVGGSAATGPAHRGRIGQRKRRCAPSTSPLGLDQPVTFQALQRRIHLTPLTGHTWPVRLSKSCRSFHP